MAEGKTLAIKGTVTTDGAPEEAESAPAIWSTDVRGTVDAYKTLGEVFLTVLAALPTATLVSTLIRAPGDAGLDEGKLIAGVFCAAVAVGLGLALAVRLRAPVRATEAEINEVKLETIIGARPGTGADLIHSIMRLSHSSATGEAAKSNAEQLKVELGVLKDVQEIATVESIRKRVASLETALLAGAAILLAAAAVALLALAPKAKPDDTTAPPSVVTYRLTDAGVKDLGCPTRTFSALKIGGDDTEPEVIPLGVNCAAGPLLKLKVEKTGLASEATSVEARSSAPPVSSSAGFVAPPQSPGTATGTQPSK